MAKNFKEFLEQRKTEYKTWTPIYCQAVRNYIHFSMRGFNHLRFKINNTPRNPNEAKYKLGLLPLVKPVIHKATKVEQYERRLAPIGGSRRIILKEMEYWALTAIVGKKNAKIRVILRRLVKSEEIHFWSVMKLSENQKSPPIW